MIQVLHHIEYKIRNGHTIAALSATSNDILLPAINSTIIIGKKSYFVDNIVYNPKIAIPDVKMSNQEETAHILSPEFTIKVILSEF